MNLLRPQEVGRAEKKEREAYLTRGKDSREWSLAVIVRGHALSHLAHVLGREVTWKMTTNAQGVSGCAGKLGCKTD